MNFELFRDKRGLIRFRLRAANGRIVLQSESYKNKRNALIGISSIKKGAATAKVVDKL